MSVLINAEELGVTAEIGDFFAESIYDYSNGTIRLAAYLVSVKGELALRVHDKLAWVKTAELTDYELLPADVPLARKLA